MSKSMLNYTKQVLQGVSFNVQLFYKEFEKAYKVLSPRELKELKDWLFVFTANKPELRQCFLN